MTQAPMRLVSALSGVLGLCLVGVAFASSPDGILISSRLYGQNAWMPGFAYAGQLEKVWAVAKPARFDLIRIGGIAYDDPDKDKGRMPAIAQWTAMIDSIRGIGAEPLVQVSRTFDTIKVERFVRALNDTGGRKIRYWSVGNEPDLHWNSSKNTSPWSLPDTAMVTGVADYVLASARKLKQLDPGCTVFGPDYADFWYDSSWNISIADVYYNPFLRQVGLAKADDGTFLFDVLAFHSYVMTDAHLLEGVLDQLRPVLDSLNALRGPGHELRWALTEFNFAGKPWSFEAGQFFAEIFGVGMRRGAFAIVPWSLHESGGDRADSTLDLSMFDAGPGYDPRSSNWHLQMLSRSRKRRSLDARVDQSQVKVVAQGDSSGLSVMLLNRSADSLPFQLHLDDASETGEAALQVFVAGQIGRTLEGVLEPSSTLLVSTDSLGRVTQAWKYRKSDADAKRPPSDATSEMATGIQRPLRPRPAARLVRVGPRTWEIALAGPNLGCSLVAIRPNGRKVVEQSIPVGASIGKLILPPSASGLILIGLKKGGELVGWGSALVP